MDFKLHMGLWHKNETLPKLFNYYLCISIIYFYFSAESFQSIYLQTLQEVTETNTLYMQNIKAQKSMTFKHGTTTKIL